MNKGIIIVGSSIVLVILIWVFAVSMPMNKSAASYKAKLEEFSKKERQMISEDKLKSMQHKVDSLISKFEKEGERLFLEEKLSHMGAEIDEIAKKFNLTLFDVAPKYDVLAGFAESGEEISELPLTIELRGRFPQFAQFLDNMSDFPFVLRIDETSMEKLEGNKPDLKIRMQGVILIRKERADENNNEKPVAKNQT